LVVESKLVVVETCNSMGVVEREQEVVVVKIYPVVGVIRSHTLVVTILPVVGGTCIHMVVVENGQVVVETCTHMVVENG
jgi:hypothetical protein